MDASRSRSPDVGNADYSEAEVVVAAARAVVEAESSAAVPRTVVPGATAQDTAGASLWAFRILLSRDLPVVSRLVPVGAPLPDVAVHVIQAEGVGLIGVDFFRAALALALGGATVRVVAIEVGLRGRKRLTVVER